MPDPTDEAQAELHVLVQSVWHRVRDRQTCTTHCNRTYENSNELTLGTLTLGKVVCPACYGARRVEAQ